MTVSLNSSIPASERPCTSRLLPFWRGTLPPAVGAAHLPETVRLIQSSRMSLCHGSSTVPPACRMRTASAPSVAGYSGAICADGS